MNEEPARWTFEAHVRQTLAPREGWLMDLEEIFEVAPWVPLTTQRRWRALAGKRVRVTVEVLEL